MNDPRILPDSGSLAGFCLYVARVVPQRHFRPQHLPWYWYCHVTSLCLYIAIYIIIFVRTIVVQAGTVKNVISLVLCDFNTCMSTLSPFAIRYSCISETTDPEIQI